MHEKLVTQSHTTERRLLVLKHNHACCQVLLHDYNQYPMSKVQQALANK
jgi:hypothetical protein